MELRLYHKRDEDDQTSLALSFKEDRLLYFNETGKLIFKALYSEIDSIRLERLDFNLRITIGPLEVNVELIDLDYLDELFDRISAFLEAYASDKCQFEDCY